MAAQHAQDVQRLSEQLGYPLAIEQIEDNIRKVISAKDNSALVAIADEKIVGWIHGFKAMLLETNPFIEIGGLVVDENHRGKGVGRKLIERIKEWSLETGIHDIRVRSNVKRKEAHQFYRNNGFTETKEQKVFRLKL